MKTKLLILLLLISLNTTAQNTEKAKTLFGNGMPQLGYFISPSVQAGKIAGFTAVVPGVGIGVVLNKRVYLGAVYKFIVNENTPTGESDNTLYLDQRWYGAKCEYSLNPLKAVHLNFPLEVGAGHMEMDKKDAYGDNGFSLSDNNASFAYVEPGVALEMNLHKFVKLNFSASYRFVSDVTFRSLKAKDLTGPICGVSLKIGLF
jgi:hypothetical protein